ncbi:MAG: SEC-C metal-binding domain-containing protein [Thermoguttaceae bacterium]
MALAEIKHLVRTRAEAAYDEKEIEFPVLAGLYHFTTRDSSGFKRYDKEGLAAWAKDRFGVSLDVEELKNKQKHEVQEHLIERSREAAAQGRRKLDEALQWVAQLYDGNDPEVRPSSANGKLASLSDWLRENCRTTISAEEIGRLSRDELERRLRIAVEERYRPEMLKMERILVLQILDEAWKNHLLVMDHLRSSVGLRGYAQVDPKVEYKREGMRTFESMWDSVGSRVTDFVFRMEQLSEDFVSSTWAGAEARHEEISRPTSEIEEQQQEAIDGTQTGAKREPIRNRQPQVGRNDPCPCGSGKKYKACHGRRN